MHQTAGTRCGCYHTPAPTSIIVIFSKFLDQEIEFSKYQHYHHQHKPLCTRGCREQSCRRYTRRRLLEGHIWLGHEMMILIKREVGPWWCSSSLRKVFVIPISFSTLIDKAPRPPARHLLLWFVPRPGQRVVGLSTWREGRIWASCYPIYVRMDTNFRK